ncbi:hypothetical protein LH128_30960 [Sphingomonas sp. LH128]|uniref:Uncharacterized protein n=1 Tax=Novosphingobium resinovorum TaxID=158500 RepID=A0A031JQA5_9SPHN|nr:MULTISPECIES: hypothetical protein [Sphingomonadaceae]EJU09046.1 hypothetical protein LH128_30960 [Sphingomonas sp. LH128]EZP77791.1 hypothetical protein BV97_04360 [Novosphingobium resinovorum]
MLTTQQVVDQVRSDAARIERFVQRRKTFLDTLDWTMLTCEQVHEAAMLDFMLEDDLAEALQRVSMAESLAAMGLPLVPTFIRYNPFPRPWHAEWLALVN